MIFSCTRLTHLLIELYVVLWRANLKCRHVVQELLDLLVLGRFPPELTSVTVQDELDQLAKVCLLDGLGGLRGELRRLLLLLILQLLNLAGSIFNAKATFILIQYLLCPPPNYSVLPPSPPRSPHFCPSQLSRPCCPSSWGGTRCPRRTLAYVPAKWQKTDVNLLFVFADDSFW